MNQEIERANSPPPDLVPPDWPACWLFYRRGDCQGNDRVQLGERTSIEKNGDLTYSCACGSTFRRTPGFHIDEAREWVSAHAPHVEAP